MSNIMTTARIFGSFTNISVAYFKTLKEIVFSPARFAETLSEDEQMPAWTYVVSGCGLVFLVWFAGALVRQGSYPAFMLEVVSLLLIIVSANAYAFFVRCTGAEAPPFVVVRDTYYYAFGTFSTWLKTLRRKNASVLFSTQSLADITRSPVAPAVIESCLSRIFLPNARAIEPESRDAYERLGLNARQIETIARAVPKRDYWFQSASGCRLFELALGPVALAFCGASRAEDLAEIDRLIGEVGQAAFPPTWLRRKQLGWAADLIEARHGFTQDEGEAA